MGASRYGIQSAVSKFVPHFRDYLEGYLSLFSTSTEPERLFREVGRQNDGRESLSPEQLEAEVRLFFVLYGSECFVLHRCCCSIS